MKRILKGALVALMVVSSTIGVKAESKISAEVQRIIDSMTPVEKVAQMIQADTRWITPAEVAEYKIGSILSGGGAAPTSGNELSNWVTSANSYQKAVIDSGGIPLLYGIDAVHGNNNLYGATIYPHNIGLAAANNTQLVEQIGEATASEVRAMGANWTFTPTLGVPHNERWGRTYETFGDDVERVTNLGTAYIKGIESDGDTLSSAKHYLGEGLTTNGANQGNVELSDADYQDLINANMNNPMVKELLTPYKQAIKQGTKSIMVTYNSINGKRCHGNKDVVTTLLKENLGFDGIVISDYNGLDQIENQATYKDKAIACINAGVDVLMVAEKDGSTPRWKNLYNALVEAVNEGKISEERLNDAVARILTAKEELGFLDNPSKAYADEADQAKFGGSEHRALAKQAVSESLVLLKNDEVNAGKTVMQALADMDNIVVAGSAGDDIGKQCGGWTITWQGATGNTTPGTTIFSGLKAAMDKKGGTISYNANGVFTNSDNKVDAAIVVVGEDPYAESNGDRSAGQLKLPANDISTIKRIENSHPDLPIILVLTTGRPIAMADYVNDDHIKGIVNAWLPGSEGDGVADVLLGDKDFVGTNPITWTWYPQDITSKYDDSSKVLYPVGYGLKKAQKTGDFTAPADPNVIDLAKTNGKLEAEAFVDAHSEIKLENNGTTVGYLQDGRHMTYKINVPEQAAYKLTVQAAREYAATIDGAFELYLDDELVLEKKNTPIVSTGSWTKFTAQEMTALVSLKAGIHELKLVARDKDFNIDYYIFEKAGDYVGPIIPDEVTNEGTGAMLQEGAVEVSMSSSENSQDMAWYKGEFEISNKNATKDPLDLRVADDSSQTTIVVNDQKTYPVNGMGMSLMRVTVGTSDFTAQDFYTYYDGTGKELDGKPDWNNVTGKGFSIQKDKDLGIIKVINEMQAIAKELGVEDNLKFFASSWTPPGWMKLPTSSSNSYEDNELLLKGGKLNDDYIDDLAKYMVRYVEEYQKCGIPIYAMTIQNEPLLEINYPSCAMTGTQEAKIAKAIKAELAKSTVLKDNEKEVKLWAFDHNFDGADKFMADFFKEAGDQLNIDGIAFHPYGGNASTMGSFYDRYKDQLSMNLTERSVWGTSGANDIITWLRNGSESYNSWVTMLDSNVGTHHWVGTPDPTLFVQDANNPQRYWATPEVYIMSQFTKYVKPGYVRVDTNNGSSSTVTNVAFKDPETGKIVMIVANRSGTDQKFKVMMKGAQFNAVLPAGNVATYIWDGSDIEINALDVPGTFTADKCSSATNANINTTDHIIDYVNKNASIDYLVDVKEAGTYNVMIKVASGEIGDTGYSLSDSVMIAAVDDDETLLDIGDLAFGTTEFDLMIEGGKFNQDLKVNDLVLSEEAANYMTVKAIKVSADGNKVTVTLERKNTNYEDVAGTISIKSNGYSDGNVDLTANLKLLKTNNLPDSIDVGDVAVGLKESDAYRKKGTLVNGAKGDYIDFYLNIKEEGNYVLTYKIKDSEAITNGLKLSGGLGLATDNLGSVSFGKYWGNAQGYAQMLNLKAGEQTLRFEVNSAGFELTNLKIEKLTQAIEVSDTLDQTTTITADKVVDGSKEIGWGIEGSTTKNIGFGSAGAYQDYYLDVKTAGLYDVKVNYSHDCGGDTKAVIMTVDGKITATLGEVTLKNSGGWSNWKDSDTIQIKLEAGKQFIRIYDDLDGFNYRNFQLTFKGEQDVTAPEITGNDAVIYVNDATDIKDLLGLIVTDDVDGDLLDKVTISGEYNYNVAGTYTITVTVSDEAGNETSKEFTVKVVEPAKLIVEDKVLTVGDKFDPLAGIQVLDVDGTDITKNIIVISDGVDTSKAGSYEVIYRITDALGNEVEFRRMVEVKDIEPDVKPVDPDEQTPSDNSGQQTIPGQVVEAAKTSDDVNITGMFGILVLAGLGWIGSRKRKFCDC